VVISLVRGRPSGFEPPLLSVFSTFFGFRGKNAKTVGKVKKCIFFIQTVSKLEIDFPQYYSGNLKIRVFGVFFDFGLLSFWLRAFSDPPEKWLFAFSGKSTETGKVAFLVFFGSPGKKLTETEKSVSGGFFRENHLFFTMFFWCVFNFFSKK